MREKSIYQRAREQSGLTQEKAAELLNIATETIASYECGRRNIPDDIVVDMAELYDCPILCYKHLRKKATGKSLPEVDVTSLSHAVVMLLKNVDDVREQSNKMLNIAYDNIIDEEEFEEWHRVLNCINGLQKSCLTIQYCRGGY